jgi:glucosamine-6-phosphate deaminase
MPVGHDQQLSAFCDGYERRIAECGRIDLKILGMDSEWHIAFNQPTRSLNSRTRLKTL